MFSLKVKKHLDHPDGRIFEPGHDCHMLDTFEISELLDDYPDYFEPADDATIEFMQDKERVTHYATAARKRWSETHVQQIDVEIKQLTAKLQQLNAEKKRKQQ